MGCRIPLEPLLSLPKKGLPNQKQTFDHFKITAAIQHLGDDFRSGHYVVHLLDGETILTIDDQCAKGSYIRKGCMEDVEQSQLFFFKKIEYDEPDEDIMDIFDQANCIVDDVDDDDDDDEIWV